MLAQVLGIGEIVTPAHSSASGCHAGGTERGVVSQTVGSGGVWEISHVSGRKVTMAMMRAARHRALVYVLAALRLTGRFPCGSHLRHTCATTGNALRGRDSILCPEALVHGRVWCQHWPPVPMEGGGRGCGAQWGSRVSKKTLEHAQADILSRRVTVQGPGQEAPFQGHQQSLPWARAWDRLQVGP